MSIRDYDEDIWQEQFGFDGQTINILKPENYYDNLLKRGEWSDNRLMRDLNRWRKKQASK